MKSIRHFPRSVSLGKTLPPFSCARRAVVLRARATAADANSALRTANATDLHRHAPAAPILSFASVLLFASLAHSEVRRDPAPIPASDDLAARVYERFKALNGAWIGTSTKGWTEETTFKTIAEGSAVLYISFDAHPNETMATFIAPDGERLLLTHVCVAKNQPRLVLTEASADGSTATFEFLDATGMSSRDSGHMDKVVYRFDDDGSFTSQWTWYENGKETWMEEIRSVRVEKTEGPEAR